ncbi:armadillo-type protein [Dipodascopsis uninucleata]
MPAAQAGSRLRFDQQLVPKAGKPIPVSDLLKRLKIIHGELAKFDQGAVDLSSINRVAKDLISANLLNHKDKGVRAFVACCLADILRLYAPDAPYTQNQLQLIFEHFVQQLKGLSDPESPYFLQYCYLLENLSQVKSIVLVSDLSDGEELMTQIFQLCFDTVKPDGLKNLEFHMGEILVQLVEEAQTIPQEVINMILAQFLRPNALNNATNNTQKQSSKVQQSIIQVPPAYSMAKTICITCCDRMSRYVAQYFTDIIYDIISKSSSDDISDSDLKELKKAHGLILEIWKAAPEVLQNVIPQLEQELLVENTQIRLLATQTVGRIAGEIPGRVNFLTAHSSCWDAWFGRQNDKSSIVRAKWAEECVFIIGNRADIVKGTIDGLGNKLIDNDERVRLAACKAIGTLSYKTISIKFRDSSIFNKLSDRVKDRRSAVRQEGISVLGNIYNAAYDDIAAQDSDSLTQLGCIPSRIFDLFYLNDKETNVMIDRCIYEKLLPVDLDDERRVTRLLAMVRHLDEKARKAFNAISIRQKRLSEVLVTFLNLCEKFNGGIGENSEQDLKSTINNLVAWFANQLPDASKAESDLNKFIKLNDRRLYKLIKECVNLESDYRTVTKYITEIKTRLSNPQSSILDSILPILYRSSIVLYNKSNIPVIVDISRQASSHLSTTAHELLKEISNVVPAVLKSHINELAITIQKEKPGFDGSVDTLKACAGFARQFPENISQDRKFLDALVRFSLEGSPDEAKHAVAIILQSKKRFAYARDLLAECTTFDMNDPHFLSKLACISVLTKSATSVIEPEIDTITGVLIKDILLKNRRVALDGDPDWVDDDDIDDECKAKVLALKILVNRLLASEEAETVKELARPVLKLLNSLVVNLGEMTKMQNSPLYYKSKLRLAAGCLLLKLAKSPVYEKMILSEDICKLALLAQDKDFQVRQAFIGKLRKYLAADLLPEKYIPIVFLVAYEPEEEVKSELITWIRARLAKQQQQKSTVMERCFARLLHLLAHHPDYGTDADDLLDFAQYIIFYLSAVATEQNISLIFYFAQRVKQVRDAIVEDQSENLYFLSDLAQVIIRIYEDSHNWSMQTWPGKMPLPADLFRALPSTAIAQKIAHKNYIPDSVIERLPSIMKIPKTPKNKVAPKQQNSAGSGSFSSGKKRKVSESGSKKKSKRQENSDDDYDPRA